MIPVIEIERAPVTGVGVYGDLYFTDEHHQRELLCHTIEREWNDNKPFVSSIPDGEYIVDPYDSPKFKQCYIVSGGSVSQFKADNSDRYGILFHKANFCTQLQGCIAPVEGFKVAWWTRSKLAGYSSKTAFDRLIAKLSGRKAKLILKTKGCN